MVSYLHFRQDYIVRIDLGYINGCVGCWCYESSITGFQGRKNVSKIGVTGTKANHLIVA